VIELETHIHRMASTHVFHWLDYAIFGVSLLVNAAVGVYFAMKQRSSEAILVGDRQLHPIPVALSLVATVLSAVFVLGMPAEIYVFGISYGFIVIPEALSAALTAHIFVPFFRRQTYMMSAYEVTL
jgi:sodium-coupled monocarboxylate transporter 8/12